jgi:UDP-glucose 4-epimerase
MIAMYGITGGAGLVGSHIARALIARGDKVRMLDNFTTGRMKNINDFRGRIEFRMGDICRRDDVLWLCDGVDVVFHCAAQTDEKRAWVQPDDTSQVNINGTLIVLRACRDKAVKRVVFMSSGNIYGNAGSTPVDETHAFHPLDPLSISKLAAEHYCMTWCDHDAFECVALRLFEVYGPAVPSGVPETNLAQHIIHSKMLNKPTALPHGGKQMRDFVHASDVANAALAASELDRAVSGMAINIGTGTGATYETFDKVVADVVNVSGGFVHAAERRHEPDALVADTSVAADVLDYVPSLSIQDGLKKTVTMIKAMM